MCFAAREVCSHFKMSAQYREMENLQSGLPTRTKIDEDLSFEPITLQRQMVLFKGALSQAKIYGAPFVPDLDFLVRLTTDYRSHQALLRAKTGVHFKNFENFLRGRHRLSPVSLRSISNEVGVSIDDMKTWAHGNEDGPLLPQMLKLFAFAERIPFTLTANTLSSVDIPCPHCKANILDDADAFWNKAEIDINPAEYKFAERLLSAVIGISLLTEIALRLSNDAREVNWSTFSDLAHPSHHPAGNWLVEVQAALGVSSLAELAIKMQAMDSTNCHVPYERLKKWSSGLDLMPLEVAKALAKATSTYNWLLTRILLARSIALVIDFLTAAAVGDAPPRKLVQGIVYTRLQALGKNVQIAVGNHKISNV